MNNIVEADMGRMVEQLGTISIKYDYLVTDIKELLSKFKSMKDFSLKEREYAVEVGFIDRQYFYEGSIKIMDKIIEDLEHLVIMNGGCEPQPPMKVPANATED